MDKQMHDLVSERDRLKSEKGDLEGKIRDLQLELQNQRQQHENFKSMTIVPIANEPASKSEEEPTPTDDADEDLEPTGQAPIPKDTDNYGDIEGTFKPKETIESFPTSISFSNSNISGSKGEEEADADDLELKVQDEEYPDEIKLSIGKDYSSTKI